MNSKEKLQAKVAYITGEIEALRTSYYAPETYQYLIEQLDSQSVLLKQLEVQEQFAAIDSGDIDSSTAVVVRS